ncbi:MAG TPA: PmoA family protein [Kiritimatiellia bacterium]|nr:PmoA family protein [Kiritimatiellia bacterium]HRU71176.1 PmoA family protein [Kiritimatiellia bacterium]
MLKKINRLVWCVAVCVAQVRAEDTRCFATDAETGAVTMRVNGTNLWTYVPQSQEGKPYFHPLCVPGTGEPLTAFRPPDHAWHLGLWFSWKYINGCNFWEPTSNAVTKIVSQTVKTEGNVMSSDVVLSYLGKGTEIVREARQVRVATAENGDYTIEWESAFTAVGGDAAFDCTKAGKNKNGDWASGGYAGLMWRFPDTPYFSYSVRNAEGKENVKACGEPSAFVEAVAVSKATGAKAKIVFRDLEGNPRHPTPWFVRYDLNAHKGRGYYLIGPAMIFHEPLKLAAGETLRFRYSVSVERIK